ncbi:MAG: folylpolyglutamate synthase/dihydrofolate synthase family protein [Thermoplasmata archaeon]
MEYKEAIEYLFNLKIYGMSLGLERIEQLLKVLGSPHEDLKAIHVAGTNGKGSVCAMLSSILQSAGYKVGLFTSPHLISFEERIVVNGKQIPRDRVSLLVERIKPIAKSMKESGKFEHPTFFEVVCAMAFEHFSEERVDYAVLEVGLGGRLDATNVKTPLVSVITSVDLDHTQVLGENLNEVAKEKAGIIKEGVPVICGVDQEEILAMIKNICKEKKCKVYSSKEQGRYTLKESNVDCQKFDIESNGNLYSDLEMRLVGEHQLKNALIALMTVDMLKRLGVAIPKKSVRKGIKNTRWPARLEMVQKNPTVVLDCAHNPAGMRALSAAMNGLFSEAKKTLVMGIMRDKDIPGIVKETGTFADSIIITKPEFDRAAEPDLILTEAKKYCDDVIIMKKVAKAINYAISNAKKDDVICISGSIFNVSEAMGMLYKKEPKPI